VLQGAAWQAEQALHLATATAWLTANFIRTPRLPPLQKLLAPAAGKPRGQTVEQKALILRALHAEFGGELTHG